MLARQELYHLSYVPSPFAFSLFFKQGLILLLWLTSDCYPPTSTFWVLGTHRPVPPCSACFWDRVLLTFCLGWTWTVIILSLLPEELGLQSHTTTHSFNCKKHLHYLLLIFVSVYHGFILPKPCHRTPGLLMGKLQKKSFHSEVNTRHRVVHFLFVEYRKAYPHVNVSENSSKETCFWLIQ
jgi:hypothetical protein